MNRSAPDQAPDLDHLVARPAASGLARLGIGTLPFNVVSLVVLGAMSAFVVLSPAVAHRNDQRADRVVTARPVASVDMPIHKRTKLPTTTSATTAAPAPTTTARRSHPATTAAKATLAAAPLGQAPAASQRGHVMACTDFSRQPDAQAVYDSNRGEFAGLDGDGDGVACEQLPGKPAPGATPAPVKVPTKDDLLRPGTKLYGVFTPQAPFSMAEVDSFAADAGKAPNTILFFQNFSHDFPAAAVTASWARGALPMITFEPIIENSEVGQPKLADITAGNWDQFFTTWAKAASAQNQPIALRFGQEMNGNWYSWSDGRLGNARGDFVAAWRHIHQIFVDNGATNVIWVWSVNRIDRLPDKTLARVYPGDDVVDWVGVSGYYRQVTDGVAPSFEDTFAATLDEIHAVAPSKLVMLTEVGAGTTEENRTAWIQSFFAGLLNHPEVIGFNWFNDFKSGGDWRIEYSGATTAAFAAGVADPRYGSLVAPTAAVTDP